MRNSFLTTVLIATYVLLGGCGGETPSPKTAAPQQSESHDDHDHDHDHANEAPQTFAVAVAQLAEMRDTIQTALAANDLKKADGPVHEVGHMLEDLDGLATKAGLSDEQLATVKAAQETLFSAFGALDETIHGKESGKSWGDVGSDIDQAIASLQKLTPPIEAGGTVQ